MAVANSTSAKIRSILLNPRFSMIRWEEDFRTRSFRFINKDTYIESCLSSDALLHSTHPDRLLYDTLVQLVEYTPSPQEYLGAALQHRGIHIHEGNVPMPVIAENETAYGSAPPDTATLRSAPHTRSRKLTIRRREA